MTPTVYLEHRPAEHFHRFHSRARHQDPGRLARVWWLGTSRVARFKIPGFIDGGHHVPRSGPAIVAPNHIGKWDHPLVASVIGRPFCVMAKSELFRRPVSGFISRCGYFPVRRGLADFDAIETALAVLDRGGVVLLYCQGERSPGGLLAPKRGVAHLALTSGAPVVPVAIRDWSGDRFRTRQNSARVVVRAGAPLRFDRAESTRFARTKVTTAVFERIASLYSELGQTSSP